MQKPIIGGKLPSNFFKILLYLILFFLFFQITVTTSFAQSTPESVIPIGDGPYALDVTADGKSAIVSLLFPATDDDPNLFWVDLENDVVTDEFRFGRRLFRIGAVDPALLKTGNGSGAPVVMVNGDLDKLTVAELTTGNEIARVPTGQNPSNVEVVQSAGSALIGNTTNLAVVTNGTGGSLSFIDLDSLSLIDGVEVGDDPRATGTVPNGRYILVVLRAENAVAVLDLGSSGYPEIARVEVGQDPTDIEISDDGKFAVVANLTNNTVSIVDISNPANPRVVRDPKTNSLQFPVGVQPTSVAITPDSTTAFIANAGSNWVTAVDLIQPAVSGILRIQRPESSIASASAAVEVTPDGENLVVAESGNSASLLVYSIETLELEPLPRTEVPDEPGATIFLDRVQGESCGFYTAGLTLQEGAEEGFWGMEVLTTAGNRLLEGGINLGGAFDADARNPGYGAFRIANDNNENQIVSIRIEATALPTEGFLPENLGLSVQIVKGRGDREPVTELVTGSNVIELEAELPPDFYAVRIKSLPGSPRGTFLMPMTTKFVDRAGGGFQGGANVGGFITRRESGGSTTAFAGFCLSESQKVIIRTEAGTTRGPSGAGNLVLTVKNRQKEVVQVVSNSTPPPPPVEPPPPPSMDGIRPDLYVDASARSGGNGSSSRPFRSITEAVGKAARRGDVILVRPGTYSPSKTGEVLPIGSPGAGLNRIPENVLLIGSGAEFTIIDAESGLRNGSPVNAMGVGSDNVRIAGFTVRGSSAVGIFVLNADHVQIDSNFFVGNGRFAVGASDTRGFMLNDNVARANNETGFSLANAQKISVSSPPAGCPSSFGACIIRNIANEHARDGFLMTTGGDYHVLSNTAMNNGISGIEVNNRNNLRPLNSIVRDNLTANNGGVLFPFSGTGILITEFAHADELSGNQAENNRPGGIAVFEDSTATLVEANMIRNSKQNGLIVQKRSTVDIISGNQVSNSGLAGIFVENFAIVETISNNAVNGNGTCSDCTAAKGGLAILGNSMVGTIHDNSFDRNSLGMQIANSSGAESITDSTFDANDSGGILVREGSTIPDFRHNQVRNNRGPVSVAIDDSTGQIMQCDISSLEGRGLSLFKASDVSVQDSTVSDAPLGGIAVYDGSRLTLDSVDVLNNGDTGVLASGDGSTATVQDSAVKGNQGYGLNAQNGATISCSGSTEVSDNAQGPTLGNVEGCN
jgi:DNA-binding beta-propeller fold protein YncE